MNEINPNFCHFSTLIHPTFTTSTYLDFHKLHMSYHKLEAKHQAHIQTIEASGVVRFGQN